jgi:hypothetical protein
MQTSKFWSENMLIDRVLNSQWRKSSQKITAVGLATVLGITGSFWLVEGAIAPKTVQAYQARVDVGLDRLPNESYLTLVRRAEQVARAAAQRSFDRDILTSQVSVVVIGRNQGAEAPILTLDVSRIQWRSRPDARRWATYYRTAAPLLGFDSTTPAVFSPVQSPGVRPVLTRPAVAPVTPPTVPIAPTAPQSPVPPAAAPAAPVQRVTPTPPVDNEDEDEGEVAPDEQEE